MTFFWLRRPIEATLDRARNGDRARGGERRFGGSEVVARKRADRRKTSVRVARRD